MKQLIEQVLGTEYKMFYSPSVPFRMLTPVLSLEQCIHKVNSALDHHGQHLHLWEQHQLNDLAKLVRANWIFQHLDREPIRKPILAHPENNSLLVDTGDTRLMALTAKNKDYNVAVVVTCTLRDSDKFMGWVKIDSTQRLLEVTEFDKKSVTLLVNKSHNPHSAIEWMEIGDASTGHHLHDQEQRVAMMKKFLQSQAHDYRFNHNWITTSIDWALLS